MLKFLKNFAKGLGNRIQSLFSKGIDETTLQEFERLLYESDLGASLSAELVEDLRKTPQLQPNQILDLIRSKLLALLGGPCEEPRLGHPHVILLVGVNGSGKTTTVAKLATYHQKKGRKVLIGACDTFRAAASEQLERWAHSCNVDLVKSRMNSDPSAVAFDALAAAKARNCDIAIIDTAGRLQTKTELMEELAKIRRTCQKQIPDAPHETLLVIDATIGQNAIDQAVLFHKFSPLTGIILTKMDGSAKGGIAVALKKQISVPIRWIGTGEQRTDLEIFNSVSFVDALLGSKK